MKVVIIGGGPAGIYSAFSLANKAKVTLIERDSRLGGTCVLYGCIPTKSMLHPLIISSQLQNLGKEIAFSIGELRKFANASVSILSKGVENTLRSLGIEILHANGHIRSGKVHAGNASIDADKVLIATGTRREKGGLSYTEDLPYENRDYNKVIVIGGDVGGIELAWLMRRLGKEVHLIDKNTHLLSNIDYDLSITLTEYLSQLGIVLHLGRNVLKYSTTTVTLDNNETINGDAVFLTFGRKTNIEGFEEIPHDRFIYVDEYLRTSIPNVYAAGDIIGTYTAHEAIYGGLVASENMLGGKREFVIEGVPKVIYTHPQVAFVGVNAGNCISVNTSSLTRAVTEKEREGFFKLCIKDNRVVGGFAFMPNAEDVISLVSFFIRYNMTVEQALDMVLPHPSYLEALLEALLRLKMNF